ncbi:hypothetical protein Tco_0343256 [Tanacetum coccineum]
MVELTLRVTINNGRRREVKYRHSQEVLVDILERITEHGLSSEITQSSGGSSDTNEGSENSRSFEDYGSSELDNVKDIITLALRLTVFIYNHNWPLSWLRKRPGWTEIIRPAATGFGNAFIALKSLVDHKNDLQSLVISSEFRKMLKLKNAVDCKQVVMNENFWNKRLIIVRVMTPLLRILRLCDSDVKLHWVMTLRTSIHCAAYWLNSAFQYDRKNFCKKPEASRGILDMVEMYFPCVEIIEVTKLLGIYRDDEGEFSRIGVVKGRNQHHDWWRQFVEKYPKMQEFSSLIVEILLMTLVYVTTTYTMVEEEPQGELDYDQLETMLDDQDEEPGYTLVDENEHDSEFRLLSDNELDAYNAPMSQ